MLSVVMYSRYNVSAHATKPYTSIIHVMWTTSEIPSRWNKSAKSWITRNTEFVYCHWNDSELEAFVADEYPWLLSTYVSYPYVIQRCDVARYLLLYRYGGTYVDLDIISITPLSVIFTSAPVNAGVIVAPTEPFGFSNDFIAVRRSRDPVIRGVIAGLRRAAASPWYPPLPYTEVMFRTGPVYFSRLVNCHRGDDRVFVIPSFNYGIYVHHVTGGSWHEWDGRIIWKLYVNRRRLKKRAALFAVSSTAFVLFILAIRNRHSFYRWLLMIHSLHCSQLLNRK